MDFLLLAPLWYGNIAISTKSIAYLKLAFSSRGIGLFLFMKTARLTFMFSTDGQLVLIWILQMHFWGMLITKSLFFMNTKFMSLTYLLLLCSFMNNSLSQTTPLWVLVSAIQLFHK